MRQPLVLVLTLLGLVLATQATTSLLRSDGPLCINAAHELWTSFTAAEARVAAGRCGRAAALGQEFPKYLAPDFDLAINSLPVPPKYDTTVDWRLVGIPALVKAGAAHGDCCEHRVRIRPYNAGSVARTASGKDALSLRAWVVATVKDRESGECLVYGARAITTCEVDTAPDGDRRALLASLYVNVSTVTVIPPGQDCKRWATTLLDATTLFAPWDPPLGPASERGWHAASPNSSGDPVT